MEGAYERPPTKAWLDGPEVEPDEEGKLPEVEPDSVGRLAKGMTVRLTWDGARKIGGAAQARAEMPGLVHSQKPSPYFPYEATKKRQSRPRTVCKVADAKGKVLLLEVGKGGKGDCEVVEEHPCGTLGKLLWSILPHIW